MKHRGDTNELRFMLLYHELGYTISKPIGDNAKYDVIVDNGINLERIQIKSTTRKDIHKGSDAYSCLVCHGSASKIKYTKNDIDFIVVYVIPEKTWYKIPVEEIKGKNVRLYQCFRTRYWKKSKYTIIA